MIIFTGLQGSGKTTYYHENLAATHVHVSKDLMRSASNRDARQRKLIEEALAAGRSVVVDNTSPRPSDRLPLIVIGRRFGAKVIACYFSSPVKDCVARNRLREGKARVPEVAIYVASRRLVPPTIEEGFDEVRIVQIPTAA